MPRRFSSPQRSQSMPVSASTSAVLPWSMWPAVPTIRFARIRLSSEDLAGEAVDGAAVGGGAELRDHLAHHRPDPLRSGEPLGGDQGLMAARISASPTCWGR